MLRWISRILDKGADLLDVKAHLAMRSLEQVGIVLVVYLAASFLLVIGIGALLASIVVLLAPVIGTGLALLVVSAGAVLAAASTLLMMYWRGHGDRRSTDELQARCARAETDFHEAIQGDSDSKEHSADESPSEMQRIISSVMDNPKAMASAGFAVVSLLGIKRTLRMVSSATMLIGLLDSIKQSAAGECAPPSATTNGQHHTSQSRASART